MNNSYYNASNETYVISNSSWLNSTWNQSTNSSMENFTSVTY